MENGLAARSAEMQVKMGDRDGGKKAGGFGQTSELIRILSIIHSSVSGHVIVLV
jgi:hypothetical protein